jgi:hypothetical protein
MKDPCSGQASTHHLACNCREKEFTKLKATLEAAVDLIRQMEFSTTSLVNDNKYCPMCFFTKNQQHAKYCPVPRFFNVLER